MAEASLKAASGHEDDTSSVRSSLGTGTKSDVAQVGGVRSKSKLTVKDLEARLSQMDKKVDEKFDRLLQSISNLSNRPQLSVVSETEGGLARPNSQAQDTVHGPSGRRRPLISLENSLDVEYGLVQPADTISLHPNRNEMHQLLQDDGNSESRESCASNDNDNDSHLQFQQYVRKDSDNLGQLFCTQTAQSAKDGIKLDQSQIDVLSKSWRSDNPEKVSCYKEEYKHTFPVSQESENFLLVPGLDDLVEPMLQKRHGKLFKPWGKGKQLCSQPLKAIESLAFQGQLAARMNIVSVAYLQQGLGSLLEGLQENNPNIDRAVQTVRDLFAISNKALDQAGRTGAYQHMIRRKAAIADTGLSTLKDVQSKVLILPLSHEGVFGKGLENVLKHRKEQKDQINDLVPEFSKSMKRKFQGGGERQPPNKKPYTENMGNRGSVRYTPQQSREFRTTTQYRPSSQNEQVKGKKETGGLQSFRIPRKN